MQPCNPDFVRAKKLGSFYGGRLDIRPGCKPAAGILLAGPAETSGGIFDKVFSQRMAW